MFGGVFLVSAEMSACTKPRLNTSKQRKAMLSDFILVIPMFKPERFGYAKLIFVEDSFHWSIYSPFRLDQEFPGKPLTICVVDSFALPIVAANGSFADDTKLGDGGKRIAAIFIQCAQQNIATFGFVTGNELWRFDFFQPLFDQPVVKAIRG